MEFINNIHDDWKTVIIIVLIIIAAIVLTRMMRWLINASFINESEKIQVDPTRYKFLKNAASLIIWLVAFGGMISMIPKLRALAITLFAGAGILVAIIGFAAQAAFSNIISGIFIVIFRPFRVGDMIKVGSLEYGIVEDITLRHTVIVSFESKRIIVPNSTVSSETIVNDNIGDPKVCRWIEIGISYDSDVELARRIIQEESIKHPRCIDVRTKKEKKHGENQVEVYVIEYADFSVNLRAYVWTNDPFHARQMHSDINIAIKKRFDAEGIEIPFPYRTIIYKKDLPPNAQAND